LRNKSIIIIGAGVSGLSAGCYAQMNGYQTKIFEMHNIPGGLCTSWKRRGYTIDGCLHWLVGAGNTSNFHHIWQELGIIDNCKMIFHNEFMRVKEEESELIIYTNINKLKNHLLKIAPEDKKTIMEFVNTVKIFAKYELPIEKAQQFYNIFDYFKLFYKHSPILYKLMKYKNISLKDFSNKFKNRFLRENFPKVFDLPDFSMAIVFFHFGWLHKKSSGYPVGGSNNFIKKITDRYTGLGGNIIYNNKIKKILIDNNKAIGVLTENGECFYADKIIYSAYLKNKSFKLLGNNTSINLDKKRNDLKPFPSLIQVSIGINNDLSRSPHVVLYNLKKPIFIGGVKHDVLKVEHSSYDDTLTPKGKSLIKVIFFSDYKYWEDIYSDRVKYHIEKNEIKKIVINELKKIYQGIEGQIEMIDVATPITYKRYTGNYKGSFEGWLIDTKTIDIKINSTIINLKNFYMTGHWIAIGGGLPLVALHARDLLQIICKNDKKKFITQ